MRVNLSLELDEIDRLAQLVKAAIAKGGDTAEDQALLANLVGHEIEIRAWRGSKCSTIIEHVRCRHENRLYVGRSMASSELARIGGDWVSVHFDGEMMSAMGQVPADVVTQLAQRFPQRRFTQPVRA